MALNNLIDDLLELAQLDAGGLKLDITAASLRDLISEGLARFQALADQRQITLFTEVSDDIDPVYLSASKISRVLDNLLGNALRYAPDHGHIWISAKRIDSGIEVAVQDDGPGFSPADISRLFEQFYRGEQARSRATGGAGLGLAIARGIIEAHGGHIWAENAADGGAKISFFLPD
jgi:signal transduction histidine kinase